MTTTTRLRLWARRLAAALLLILGSLAAAPAATEVTAILWITNTPAGLTSNLTVNAGTAITRYWTNDASATNSLLIQTTNTTTASRTNLMVHLAGSPLYTAGAGSPQVSVSYNATNTSALNLTAPDNTNLTVTANGTWARITYVTNTYVESAPILNRTNAMSQRERTNAANAIANYLNLPVTNPVSAASSALTNFANLYAAQTLSNKLLYGSVLDGGRDTNSLGHHGTNLQFTVFILAGPGGISGLTNLAGNLGSGALTNGTLYSNVLHYVRGTNLVGLHGTLFLLKDGTLTNVALDRPFSTNLINYGNAIRSHGSGGNSFQAGSNAQALGSISIALGNGTIAAGASSFAAGIGATATNNGSMAIGNPAYADDLSGANVGSMAFGNNSRATNNGGVALGPSAHADGSGSLSVGNGAEATGDSSAAVYGAAFGFQSLTFGGISYEANTLSLGYGSEAGHSNSAAIGPPDNTGATVATSTTNQLRLGTGRQVVSMPGFYQGTASNLVTAAGQTNRIDGSIMTYPAEISTIALGANRINMGTNVTLHLLGSPGGTFSIDGIVFGSVVPAIGQWLELRNATGFDATLVHESGLEATAAYRISSPTSTNVIFASGATAQLRYYLSRWVIWNVWDGRQPTATATNAVGWLDGNATNLTVYGSGKPPLRIWPQTGSVSNSFEVLTTNGALSTYIGTNGTLTASNMAVTPFGSQVELPYRLFTVTNMVVVTNATTETALLSNLLGTASIPANWWTPGKSIQLSIRGRYYSGAIAVATNWVRLGSTMIATNMAPVVANVSGDMWNHDLTITCRSSGASGVFVCQGMTTVPNTAGGTTGIGRVIRIINGGTATVDTTAAQALAFNIHPGATAQAFHIEAAHALVIP